MKQILINCLIKAPASIAGLISTQRSRYTQIMTGKNILWYGKNIHNYLRLGQIQGLGELLALLPHHVLVLLEGLLELEQLAWREGGSDSLWFAERKKELG